ncbi:hypothetical protein GLAREA_07023 [Glarea lozoyensis ATCC 20868]|uniref:Inner kinetochore subunit AME1 domain-containing protein n=1 Tax=Glarea lozoyensis (strain ATCC 20868 / MF5171) TaxID=1116229 RepID=S3D8C7_GLAL2|nr:uncharacterized protein GLAREA_07023 [Glarea lozoyensis ATCC 20868]EPE34010.1 hypothetical protein GLAREA_07023 [Glarea lozoyensis ATCC 20868]
MESTREERMQQRLRGSQRRQVKEVDFGLTFPVVPAAGGQESPANPQLEGAPTPQITFDANKGSGEELNPRPAIRSGAFDANTSAKRRKLNNDGPSSGQNVNPAPLAPIPDIYAIPGDDGEDAPVQAENDEASNEKILLSPRIASPELGLHESTTDVNMAQPPPATLYEIEQVNESPANAPGSGHRARVLDTVLPASSQLNDVINSSPLRRAAATPRSPRRRSTREISASPVPTNPQDENGILSPSRVDAFEESELSPIEQAKRPNKRLPKSDGQPRPATKRTHRSTNIDEDPAVEDVVAISDNEAAAILGKHYAGRNEQALYREASPDLGSSMQTVSTPADRVRKKSQRSHRLPGKRQQRSSTKPKAQVSKNPSRRASLRSGSPIPVTVHRLTKRPRSSIDEHDPNHPTDEVPYARRPGVNSIDVLSQVCTEIIDSGLSTLEEGRRNAEDNELRREYKTKWSALKSFGSELQSRLLSHTINLDNGYTLDKRVREELKKKVALREEILRVRLEREQLALQMDEIRIKHENETKLVQERDALNTAAHDIELAVDRGRTNRPVHSSNDVKMSGPEVILKRIVNKISNKGDSGGILKQIKDFNGFLERAALALESKAG